MGHLERLGQVVDASGGDSGRSQVPTHLSDGAVTEPPVELGFEPIQIPSAAAVGAPLVHLG